jgi:hypothetical protein
VPRIILNSAALTLLVSPGGGTAVANAAIDPLRVQWALDAIHVGDLGRQPRRSVAARRAIGLLQPPAQPSRTHRPTFRRSID